MSFLCKIGWHKPLTIKVEEEGIPINFEDWGTFYFKYQKCKRCGFEWKESILRYEYKTLSYSLSEQRKDVNP